ncbi:MAG TPA: radical SAM family heme chaperone HemW [Desulfobulbus sp.]|nr:radical SAM family heme chaperone HemW [Desulfobulbus sp.]HHD63356.1 radical SAM family heme chaperone HemW [Desulfobulbaceae bacterium]
MTVQRCLSNLPDITAAHRQGPCSALYLHVPFCLRKCPYCSFFSLAGKDRLHALFAEAVDRQIKQEATRFAKSCRLETIFFGGGTPTLLPAETLADLLGDCLDCFPTAADNELEITIEVNPATVDKNYLGILRRAGFNRLSIGVQSFTERELALLGRPHTALDARQTFYDARQAGFTNINLDLMYGLPGQRVADWRHNLKQALTLEPEHLSLYELTIEENTPFAEQVERGSLHMPMEEEVIAMLELTLTLLRQAKFERYEISNYGRRGFHCRHNINYWHNRSYIGLGPGAVACLDDVRYTAGRDIEQFANHIAAGKPIWEDEEHLTKEERFRETMIMGLRMTSGVSISGLQKRFGIDPAAYYGPTLDGLIKQDLLHRSNDHLRLTDRGLLLADAVMVRLV